MDVITFSLLSLLCANSAGAPAHRLHGRLSHTMELKRPCPPLWIHAGGWNADPLQLQESSQRRQHFLEWPGSRGLGICVASRKRKQKRLALSTAAPLRTRSYVSRLGPGLLSAGGCMYCHMFHNVLSQISLEEDHYSDRGSQKE